MTFERSNKIFPVERLLLAVALLVPALARADGQPDHVQFCWAMGRFDHTVYYAEAEDREDRRASFETLLDISGIDHQAVTCTMSDAETYRRARAALFRDWRESELEIVNTTFLSDLDY